MTAIDQHAVLLSTLRAIRSGLIGAVIPDLAGGDAISVSHMVLRLVDHMIATEEVGVPNPAEAAAAERDLAALAIQQGEPARAALHQYATAELARLVRLDPEAAGGVVQMYLGGRTSRAEETIATDTTPKLSAETLTSYLSRRFPNQPEITVQSLQLLPGGMSKQTFKVGAGQGGQPHPFVLRKDFAISASTASVVDEYAMLTAMWGTGGMPMAEPFWLEPDPSIFGTPLMAVSLAEGSTDYSAATNNPTTARIFADALAGAMARLHALPLQRTTAGPLIERTGRAHVAAEVDRWHTLLQQSKIRPEPVLEACFAWLRANIPDLRAPPAIVHGDIGFHNMLMQDGRLTALLDWEFAHIGDPAEDVVYARFFVEQVIDWETFLGFYEAHGGIRPSAAQEQFYAVWQSARNAAGCSGAEHAFLTKPGADLKLGVSGMTFKQRFALDALQRIAP